MKLANLFHDPYLVFVYSFALTVFSIAFLSSNPSEAIVVLILIAIASFLVRPVYDSHMKSMSYVLLGMLGYWVFGSSLVSSASESEPALSAIIALSAFGAILALVAYSDGKLSGHAMASGSLMLLFFASKEPWSLLCAVLIFGAAHTLAMFISRITGPENFLENVAKGACFSGLALSVAALSKMVPGVILRIYDMPDAFSVVAIFLCTIAVNTLIILCSLKSFDLVLARVKLKRFVEENRVMYGSVARPEER